KQFCYIFLFISCLLFCYYLVFTIIFRNDENKLIKLSNAVVSSKYKIIEYDENNITFQFFAYLQPLFYICYVIWTKIFIKDYTLLIDFLFFVFLISFNKFKVKINGKTNIIDIHYNDVIFVLSFFIHFICVLFQKIHYYHIIYIFSFFFLLLIYAQLCFLIFQ
ncbi:NADH dehydrogenase subunit 2, partial [Reticulomyxa filosa]